jgi:hypothetical protein
MMKRYIKCGLLVLFGILLGMLLLYLAIGSVYGCGYRYASPDKHYVIDFMGYKKGLFKRHEGTLVTIRVKCTQGSGGISFKDIGQISYLSDAPPSFFRGKQHRVVWAKDSLSVIVDYADILMEEIVQMRFVCDFNSGRWELRRVD